MEIIARLPRTQEALSVVLFFYKGDGLEEELVSLRSELVEKISDVLASQPSDASFEVVDEACLSALLTIKEVRRVLLLGEKLSQR